MYSGTSCSQGCTARLRFHKDFLRKASNGALVNVRPALGIEIGVPRPAMRTETAVLNAAVVLLVQEPRVMAEHAQRSFPVERASSRQRPSSTDGAILRSHTHARALASTRSRHRKKMRSPTSMSLETYFAT